MNSMSLEDEENRMNPLTVIDLQKIDEVGLSNHDKHYIRLMAHCLGCFKAMLVDSTTGALPDPAVRAQWLLSQGKDLADESFLNVLLEQFVSAAIQLEHMADHFQKSPLELTLDDLIQFVKDEDKL